MSHSGNNAARRLRTLTGSNSDGNNNNNKKGGIGDQLYNPSVFRYKCVGYLHLSSEQKGSPGVCRGLQTRVEKVADMVGGQTREAAIKKFLDAASDLGTYVDSDDSAADQKVKEIYTSRTMIYKDDWPTLTNINNKDAKIQPPPKSSPFPEEELIDKTEWSCYGSTQVHFLVLDPVPKVRKVPNRPKRPRDPSLPPELAEMQARADEMFDVLEAQLRNFDKHFSGTGGVLENNNKGNANKNPQQQHEQQIVTKIATSSSKGGGKICAITPENIGLSVRKIDSAVGHFTVADIGSIRICLETSSSLMGDDNNKHGTNADKSTASSRRGKNVSSTTAHDKSNTIPGTAAAKDNQNADAADPNNPDDKKKTTIDFKKFFDFTVKVGQKMEQNVIEIKEAVSDDFPGRTYNFGSKVVGRMYQTTDQTFTYMGKILNSWWRSM